MVVKTRQDLIKAYLEFFKKKDHKIIPSASLIPENDPTVLFTTAGMHPLVPFLLGQKHPLGKRIVDVQKCIRTGDIEEVGDTTHHTFFEMLGNWSLGDYFKKEAIEYSFEFLTKILQIPLDRLAVSVFKGNENAPKDEESGKIWLSLGIPKERIAYLPKENNWWETAAETGPCGPDTEMFYWKPNTKKAPKNFDPLDGNWVEIWNDVLMEYEKTKGGKYIKAKQQNIDTGMGVERTLTVLNGLEDPYQTSLFEPIIKHLEKLSKKNYNGNEKAMRIIADHIKAAVLILGDTRGIKPSNVGQGYVLRRLIRRAIRYGKMLSLEKPFTSELVEPILTIYSDYSELKQNQTFIKEQLTLEENKFNQTLEKGIKEFEKMTKDRALLSGKEAFLLFQSYGFPIEFTEELADEKGIEINLEEYNKEFKSHQELSRSSSSGTFKSGLADNSEATRKLHTATHLLNEALRKVLDKNITQKGSNITPERLRFDFNFPRKLTPEELKKVEDEVNSVIKKDLSVRREETTLKEALSSGAQAEFGMKYPEKVSVYTVGAKDKWYSREICTGPHVSHTQELGSFKILKEEAVAAGVRRIKAIVV